MGATYTRQSSAGIVDGGVIEATDLNNEFDQLLAAFAASSGHTHDGTAAEGGPVAKLLGTAITIGDGTAGTDIAVTFDGETNDGVLTWMEDEDLFKFSDAINVGVDDTGYDVKFFGATSGKYWLWDESADGVVQIGTLTVGVDDAGHDVKFFGDTASAYMLWDTSADDLVLAGAAGIDLAGDIDVDGTANLDVVDIDGAVQLDATLTVGADDQGYDIKFFGDTASAYMLWDTSADDLVFAGSAGIDLAGDIDVDGTANLDNTDIDGTLAVDGTTISLDATTSLNIDNSNTSNGITIGTATSGVPISIGHATSEVTINDNLTVTGTLTLGSNAELTEAELEFLDGITAGTAAASKAMVLDSNADITGGRNLTISGELDAATGDFSGDVDVDGTLEADAITIDGTTLAETIADTVGAMVSSNTETGITVTYEDGDNTLDFALGAAQTTITSLLATDIKIGEDDQTKIDFETADTINFYAGNEKQLILTDGALTPGADNILDLGSSGVEFKDAYFDGTVTADAFAGPLTGDVTGNVSGTAATVTTAAQSNITSLGTLTTLTIDNIIADGTTIGHTSDTDLLTLTSGVLTVAGEVSMTTLDIGGTNITATAAELNYCDGVTSNIQTQLTALDPTPIAIALG